MSDRVRTGLLSFALGAVVMVAAGCGGNSFVGRHFDNFTAYYNTFYNARTAFDEGVKALQQKDEPVDRRYYIDLFSAPSRASNSEHFQNAIDKSADVLRDHPGSKWVDDALLLIGKSYFYQHNFVGAEQKFREVIDIGSALEDEARLWHARTLIAAGAHDEARDHLLATLNQEDLSARWKPRVHLALGELYVRQGSYEEAAEQLELGLEEVRDNDLEARAWLLLGQVLETLGRYDDAVAAYESVSRAHPRYELSYAANVSAVRVRGLHLDAEQALQDLRRMQRDDKNFSNRFELAYLEGLIHQAEGRTSEARENYHDVLYDSEGQIGDLRGRIHYALGELYSNDRQDFMLASAHYDTANTALSSNNAGAEEQYTPEAITDASRKAEMFSTFAEVRREIARMDSLLDLGSLSDEEFMERIMEIRRMRAEELSEQQRQVEQRQAARGFQDAAASSSTGTRSAANEATGAAGFLFHRDPIRVQESRMSFITRWGERPHVPNWRRSEAVAAASSNRETADAATAQRIEDNSAGVGQAPLPPIDYSDVPRDSLSRARMLAARALARYELGNVLFLAMERPDSAAAWYRMVIEQDPGENVAQRAYYALAEVQRSLGDTAAANTMYQQVLRDYPDSDFAGRVREQLGVQGDVRSDSVSVALEEYQSAFFRWQQGHHRLALNDMVTIAAEYHRTEAAPKALLAAGRIFLEWATQDSMDVFAPLPLTVSDAVLERAGLRGQIVDRTTSTQPASQTVSNDPAGTDPGDESDLETQRAAERRASNQDAPTPRPRIETRESEAGQANGDRPPRGERLQPRKEPPTPGDDSVRMPGDDAALTLRDDDSVRMPRDDAALTLRDDDSVRMPRDDSALTPRVDDSTLARRNGDSALTPRDDAPASTPGGDRSTYENAEVRGRAGEVEVNEHDASSDSTAIEDSVRVSMGEIPGDGQSNSEEIDAVDDDAVYLETLYASIQSRYPGTVYADHAAEMQQALESYRAELQAAADSLDALAATDSTTMQPDSVRGLDSLALAEADAPNEADSLTQADSLNEADSLTQADSVAQTDSLTQADSVAQTDSLTQADSLAQAGALAQTDSVAEADARADTAAATTQARSEPSANPAQPQLADAAGNATPNANTAPADSLGSFPVGEESMRSSEGIDAALGGYTIVVGMNVQKPPMDALAEEYAAKGFRTGVLVEKIGSTTLYRAAVGQFRTTDFARRALARFGDELGNGAQVAPLSLKP